MNISINTTCLFGNLPLDDSFSIMQKYGCSVFEQWMIPQSSVEPMRKSMDRHSMSLSAFCTGFFILNDKARHDAYETALLDALRTAKTLSCPSLITQVGQVTGEPRPFQHEAIVQGLLRVKPHLENACVTLLVEPLNDTKDHKGYYLTSSQEGFDIIQEVDSPNVKLLFDVYHQLHMGEEVMSMITDNLDLIGHFHAAGFPNRDERIFENFNYRQLFNFLNGHQVAAPVGLELFPSIPGKAIELLAKLHEHQE